MSNYWHPKFKFQLVEWFTSRHPNYPKWEKMSKKQLAGKYKEERQRDVL